jgi:hypothetical protein
MHSQQNIKNKISCRLPIEVKICRTYRCHAWYSLGISAYRSCSTITVATCGAASYFRRSAGSHPLVWIITAAIRFHCHVMSNQYSLPNEPVPSVDVAVTSAGQCPNVPPVRGHWLWWPFVQTPDRRKLLRNKGDWFVDVYFNFGIILDESAVWFSCLT